MAEEDGEEAVAQPVLAAEYFLNHALYLDDEQQHGQAGDDVGHHHRRGHHAGKQGAAAKTFDAGEGIARQRAEDDGGQRGGDGDAQRQPGGFEDLVVVQQLGIPFGGEAAPNGDQLGFVEGIHHQHNQGDVEEGQAEEEHGTQKPRGVLPFSHFCLLLPAGGFRSGGRA